MIIQSGDLAKEISSVDIEHDLMQPQSYDDKIAELYAGRIGTPEAIHNARSRIDWMCDQVVSDAVLDIGCSQGVTSILLGKKGFKVTGVDPNPRCIAYAKNELLAQSAEIQSAVDFLCCGLDELPGNLRFNTIVMGEVIEHLSDPEGFLLQAVHYLEEGGKLIVTTPFGYHPHEDHKSFIFPRSIVTALSKANMYMDSLSIVDGYIRYVSTKQSHKPIEIVSHELIAEITEQACLEAQKSLMALSRKRLDHIRALKNKLNIIETKLSINVSLLGEMTKAGSQFIKMLAKIDSILNKERGYKSKIPHLIKNIVAESIARPSRLPGLPIDTCRAIKTYYQARIERKKLKNNKQLRDSLWFVFERVESDLPASRSAKANPQWVVIPAKSKRSIDIKFELISFESLLERGGELRIAAIDSSGNKIPWSRKIFLDIAEYRDECLCIPLKINFSMEYKWNINLPDDIFGIMFSVIQGQNVKNFLTRIIDIRLSDISVESDVFISSEVSAREGNKFSQIQEYKPRRKKTRSSSLRILTLFDNFTEVCFYPEATLIPLSRSEWHKQIEKEQIDMFFAESVWRGNGGTWNYCMTKLSSAHGDDLRSVLSSCREKKIPTVFWNKEDPANFDVFIEAARLFDYVFTTDSGCVQRYKEILGHDRVAILPFAAQPAIHYPLRPDDGIRQKLAFAGSWSGDKYPARAKWLDVLLGESKKRSALDIFDRYANSQDEHLKFPARFKDVVCGALPYKELVNTVYKGYSGLINVNSVEDSETMVARRVYEIAACGTPVITSPSPALDGDFRDVVWSVNNPEDVNTALDHILACDIDALARATRGVRLVHGFHTYRHRMNQICKAIGKPVVESLRPSVTCIIVSKRPEFLAHIASQMNSQTYSNVEIIFVAHSRVFSHHEIQSKFHSRFNVRVFDLDDSCVLADGINLAMQNAKTDYLAKIDDDDYYGPCYLEDQMLAFEYSNAGVVGKGSYFAYVQSADQLVLRFSDRHYSASSLVHGGTLVWDRRETGDIKFSQVRQGTDSLFLKAIKAVGIPIYSTDPFNFVHVRYSDIDRHTWKISDNSFLENTNLVGHGLDLKKVFI